MPRFRKKPVVIEARQVPYSGDYYTVSEWWADMVSLANWCSGEAFVHPEDSNGIFINTLEGQMFAQEGDWVIKGVKGEFYPCKPDIFEATYERAEPRNLGV